MIQVYDYITGLELYYPVLLLNVKEDNGDFGRAAEKIEAAEKKIENYLLWGPLQGILKTPVLMLTGSGAEAFTSAFFIAWDK